MMAAVMADAMPLPLHTSVCVCAGWISTRVDLMTADVQLGLACDRSGTQNGNRNSSQHK